MNRKISEVLPNFIIINGEPEFSYGILFPHNIVYDGEEISLPFAKEIIKNILKEELYPVSYTHLTLPTILRV